MFSLLYDSKDGKQVSAFEFNYSYEREVAVALVVVEAVAYHEFVRDLEAAVVDFDFLLYAA